MKDDFGSRKRRDAQTWVFFLLAFGTIMLLCGLAIDSGLLYLAKARLSRAVDGAALAAVGNFDNATVVTTDATHQENVRDSVAMIMRNFAVANFTDLSSIGMSGSTTQGGDSTTTTLSNGTTGNVYTYNFNDGTQDANGQYKRFVQVVLTAGAGGGITSAACNARCPVQTYFMGYASYAIGGRQNVEIGGYKGVSAFMDLKVSSSAVATRNPRLIMIVVDRSASMLQPGGGAYGLPQAVTQFLDFFDTSSDYIGIVSFGSSARLEMPLTTNFINAGTNVLFDAYDIDSNEEGYNAQNSLYTPVAIPGPDPEEFTTNADYDSGYALTGVRRLKFGGQTAADEGIRLAMEQLMANSGFNDPDVVKYMVIFTDGAWNASRTLVAAPGYTNVVTNGPAASTTVQYLTNATAKATATGGAGAWNTNLVADTNLVTVPTLSPYPYVTNAIAQGDSRGNFSVLAAQHTNDFWISADGINEPLTGTLAQKEGAPATITTNTWVGQSANTLTNYYTHSLDVWLPPGSVDYYYSTTNSPNPKPYVSNFNNPTQHINIYLNSGDSNVLVVPGYVADGILYDGLDLNYPDDPAWGNANYPRYRTDNYQEAWMWPDDTEGATSSPFASTSLMRQLMFRNWANLLTGFYVTRPDEPLSTQTEPLDDTTPATQRPLYGLGAYYPSAGFYWPFGAETAPVGVDQDATYMLVDPTTDPDTTETGQARHAAYSINMLSPAAAPEWSGEWFYKGTGAALSGTGTTSASTLMGSKSDWQLGAPSWIASDFDQGGEDIMTNESAHNTNLAVSVWRPSTFSGTLVPGGLGGVSPTDSQNYTGGYVTDGNGNYYRNSMAWSGRPTHYYDFSQSKWIPVADNHTKDIQALPLGNWKAQEYAWHARAMGVTIYTVGYGYLVSPDEQVLLAQIANSTNTTAGNAQTANPFSYTAGPGTAISYNPSQPLGQQFFATNADDISTDFFEVGQAINAALTQ